MPLFNKNKGLSSLVGEAIMIGLVFTVAVFVYLWTGSFSNDNISKTNEKVYELTECTQIKGTVDEFFYDLTTGNAKILISVAPSGKSYVIEKIELYNEKGERCLYNELLVLEQGESKFVEIQCNTSFINSCKDLKSLAVISPCSDKSIFIADPLVDAVAGKCKLRALRFF